MAEPIRYMVVCDHPELKRRYFVADIDDDRPNGGTVRFDLYRGFVGARVTPANKRGSRWSVIPFTCGAATCTLNPELRETSLPDLLDKVGPHRDRLFPVENVPIYERPSSEEVESALFNDAPGLGVVVGHEQRYVMQLDTLCESARMLRVRDKR